MKKLFVIFGLIVTSCTSSLESIPEPENLISEVKMAQVLHDLMLLEGHINFTYETVNRYNKIMTMSGEAVLKEHGITKENYEESFEYYNGNQEKFERILDDVMERFNKESIKLQQEIKDTILVLD